MFLPNHRSDMDFLLLSYINAFYSLELPFVCGTENFLNIPVITTILKNSGGFFVHKDKLDDELYRACVYEYISKLIRSKTIIEHFIEMSRSKNGKIQRARNVVLPFFIDAFLENPSADIKFVPITMNYDRVHEGESFPLMLLGEQKSTNSFGQTFRSFIYCKDNYGKAFVRYCQPISLKEKIDSFIKEKGRKQKDLLVDKKLKK